MATMKAWHAVRTKHVFRERVRVATDSEPDVAYSSQEREELVMPD